MHHPLFGWERGDFFSKPASVLAHQGGGGSGGGPSAADSPALLNPHPVAKNFLMATERLSDPLRVCWIPEDVGLPSQLEYIPAL
jgi:hypothetical protein